MTAVNGNATALPATAQLYPPAGRREWFWFALACPHCGEFHLGRARTADEASGPRRVGCGRQVAITIGAHQ